MELPGFIADAEIGFAGTRALERAQRAAEALRLRLADWSDDDVAVDLVGVNSVLRAGVAADAARAGRSCACTSRRAAPTREGAQIVEDEVYALTLSGPAGGCSVRSEKRARIEVVDGYIAADRVTTSIEWSRSSS